jgi:hypothetical protein
LLESNSLSASEKVSKCLFPGFDLLMDFRAGICGEQLAGLAKESCRQHRQFLRIPESEFGHRQPGVGPSVGSLH